MHVDQFNWALYGKEGRGHCAVDITLWARIHSGQVGLIQPRNPKESKSTRTMKRSPINGSARHLEINQSSKRKVNWAFEKL